MASGESFTNPADIFERANETFKEILLWMLQCYATAKVNTNVSTDQMLLNSIAQGKRAREPPARVFDSAQGTPA